MHNKSQPSYSDNGSSGFFLIPLLIIMFFILARSHYPFFFLMLFIFPLIFLTPRRRYVEYQNDHEYLTKSEQKQIPESIKAQKRVNQPTLIKDKESNKFVAQFCSNCGSKFNTGDNYCSICGSKLE